MVHVALHLQHSCTYEPLMNHSHLHFHSTTVSNTVTSYTALLPLFPSPSHDTLLHPPHCTNSPPSISHNTPCPFSLSHNTPSLHSPSHMTLPLTLHTTLPLSSPPSHMTLPLTLPLVLSSCMSTVLFIISIWGPHPLLSLPHITPAHLDTHHTYHDPYPQLALCHSHTSPTHPPTPPTPHPSHREHQSD